MYERLITKLGASYIVWMMAVTRLGGLIGGAAVVYYVRLTLDLSGDLQHHFNVVASIVVLLAVTGTVLLALWETRALRAVMRRLHVGHSVPIGLGKVAGREAVVFPARHHRREAVVVPLVCLPPVYIYLTWATGAPVNVLIHITVATFMGVACALSLTYLIIERMMQPVVRHLTDYGVVIDYETLPTGQLQNRLIFLFTLIIIITAVMIAALANQKVAVLMDFPGRLDEVIASLRVQTVLISACAVTMGLVLSVLLARSVTTRVTDMVHAMRRVETGHLDERITATSTDEIGMVGRSFNRMVAQLEQNEATIRDLNAGLERKVEQRTQELAESKQELQESYERLKEHDRLKTEFFSNVSHELRTPLTLIQAPVENMLQGRLGSLSTEQLETLSIVRRNTARLLTLINDLLDFAKLEANRATITRVPTDLCDLIDELVSSASVLAVERGIRLTFDSGPQVPPSMLDHDKIEKVVINLLSNALKFTPKGGRVDVKCSTQGNQLQVSVADTGIGIAAQDQDRIFQRFVQVDGSMSRQYEGTGLGLPLAREFVALHGGKMELVSEPGKGSCFSFRLPLIPAPAAPNARKGDLTEMTRKPNYSELLTTNAGITFPVESAEPKGNESILIVDDSPDVLAVLKMVLAPDYHMYEASDGETGLRVAVEHNPDVIISDVMMPRMDGYEFCARIKEDPKTARIGFIMLTAKADMTMKIEGLEQGADDYLLKPFNPQELRARVRSLLKIRRLDRQVQKRNEELERALAELRQTQEHLVNSEKMRSLGQLAAGVAHEINNSINAVYNGILPLTQEIEAIEATVRQALCDRGGGHGTTGASGHVLDGVRESLVLVRELSQAVEAGAIRTTNIVTDLKSFAHPGRGGRSLYDVHDAIEVALSLLRNRLKNRIQVHRDFCEDGRIECSGAQLAQVFINLLENAQYAIEERGEIRIRTTRTTDQLIVRVRDSGNGIPEDVLHEIFDPFFTTKDVGVGTGLGLSVSYSIVRGHNGMLEVASPPPDCDSGTEFTITLPLRSSGVPSEEASQSRVVGTTVGTTRAGSEQG